MITRMCVVIVLIVLILALWGCSNSPQSTKAFVLPEGDIAAGEATFMRMRCYDCHRIAGVDLPVAEEEGQVLVDLGGDVSKVKTYGDLLTSIVNPSHRLASGYADELVAVDGQSRMTHYNDVMTVSELTNLVAYLQTKYRVKRPVPPQYPPYHYY
jgi:sulfur-oxidizing protein SoxX